jgi:dTDP-4-amino-4,6-dideoxygalactose transaminase
LAKETSPLGDLTKNKLIRLSKSCIGDAEKHAVMRVLDKEFLGMGEQVRIFEEKLSDFFGREAVCVVNGTAALHLALQACEIGIGDEVLVPSITYVASFQAITATGATPIACDLEETSLCLDWLDAEKRITSKTKAIMPVHYSGGVGELDKIYKLAEKYKLRVVEDAAHAFGTTYKNQKVGGFGDISCFSFDGIKNITSGEGGCIVTDDEQILDLVRDARLLGVEKDSDKRYKGQRSWDFNVRKQGWRYHMSDIMAAIGIEQLNRFDTVSAKRREIANIYTNELRNCDQITYIDHDYEKVVPHIFPTILSDGKSRDDISRELSLYGIQTGIHYIPNHLHSFFKSSVLTGNKLNVAERIYPSLLTLPLHEGVSKSDVKYIVGKLTGILK